MIQRLYHSGWYEWLLAIGFGFIVLSVLGVYQLHRDYAQKETEKVNQFAVEQGKLELVSQIYGLRNQLKVQLQNLVAEHDSEARTQLIESTHFTRQRIVEKSSQLRALEQSPNRLAILEQQLSVLNQGLSEQFYFQSLVKDFDSMFSAQVVLYNDILPIQNQADILLTQYNDQVLKALNSNKNNLLHYQSTKTQALNQWMLWGLMWVLVVSVLVFWLVIEARRQEKSHAQKLEDQVTERTSDLEATQTRLRRTLAEHEAMFHSAPDAILKTDMQANIIGANPAVKTLFGYEPASLIGHNVKCLMPHSARLHHDQWVASFSPERLEHNNKMGQLGRVQGLTQAGQVFPVEATIGQIKESDQRGYTVMVRDVSRSVEIEQTLMQQKDILQVLWQATNDFMLTRNIKQVAEYLLQELIAFTDSEFGFIGEVLHDAQGAPYLKTLALTNIAWNEETRALYAQNEAKDEGLAFTNLETLFGEVITQEAVVISNDPANDPRARGLPPGHPPLKAFLGVPVFYANKLLGMIGMANREEGYDHQLVEFLQPFSQNYGALLYVKRMLSVQDDMHAALVEERNEAKKANQAKSQFLASMSHELRTPLNAILGYAQLLEMDELSEEQTENVEEIVQAGEHLLDLINVVLDLSKIEAGKIEMKTVPTSLASIVEDSVGLVKTLADKAQVTISMAPMTQMTVEVDPVRLKQVLLNLLSNAIKYNQAEGQVAVSLDQSEPDHVIVWIKDTGEGITPEHRAHMFEPFNRLGRDGGVVEGTGVGLAISKELVQLHGGDLIYQPNTPQGSCFGVQLPIR